MGIMMGEVIMMTRDQDRRDKRDRNTFDLTGPSLSRKERRRSFFERIMVTGFVGGVLWSSLGWLAHFLNFAEISPNLILQPFVQAGWKDGRWGNLLSILLIGLLSILAAFLYYAVFKKVKSMWGGFFYGLILWALVFYGFAFLFPAVKNAGEYSGDTNVTTLCLYILFGVFVGYSISFEENELGTNQKAKPANH